MNQARTYYLDANICVFIFRGKSRCVREKIDSLNPDRVKIPSMVKAELLVGAVKSAKVEENIKQVEDFCYPFEIVPFDDSALLTYAEIRAALERRGQKIGFNDTIIAATVLARKGTLVTNNTREFSRIDGLECIDWTQE